jgi:uncharacterized protein YprB with RNaseH-like and TPR domain/predicted nuclease with RNAse H fold/dephospho-CoA kinase
MTYFEGKSGHTIAIPLHEGVPKGMRRLMRARHSAMTELRKSKERIASRLRKGPLKPTQLASSVREPARIVFLDIETTGLSRYYDELTLVGYAVDGSYHVHIAGDDPEHLRNTLAQGNTLVTFNGTLFDIPFLTKTFGELTFPATHIDLRYVGRRVGLTGGQKKIERELGIALRDGIEDVDGRAAVLLWHQYLRGDDAALRKLIAYNESDIRGMFAILDHVLSRLELPADLFFERPIFSNKFRRVGGLADPAAKLPSAARLGRRFTTFASLFEGTAAANARVVGIDLTGSAKRASGFCVLQNGVCQTDLISTDEEIVAATLAARPALISIDSPLSLPRGRLRVTDDDLGRSEFGIMRICERTLKRRGVNVYPCLLPSMQRLTQRGMELATVFRKLGIPVIESYPGAAQDIMGIPRKGAGEDLLKEGLANFGLTGDFVSTPVKHDELDAITSAIVGCFFLAGKYEALRAPEEGALIIPDLHAKLDTLVIGFSGRIGSGKTTAARFLESQGYAYVRFSEVIDDVIVSEGKEPNRKTRQNVGWRINKEHGQRWLCDKVIERVGGARKIVIDGLRFPEDHSYFVEAFASLFAHIHLQASTKVRMERLKASGISQDDFLNSESQPTESQVDELQLLATLRLNNDATIDALKEQIVDISETVVRESRYEKAPPGGIPALANKNRDATKLSAASK